LLHQDIAGPLDVHGPAADEVQDLLLAPGRTELVDAADRDLALLLDQGIPADRTGGGKDEGPLVARAHLGQDAHHLGDDLASLLDRHPVADQEPQARQFLGVVQRGALHHGAQEVHRLQVGHRGGVARPADLHGDLAYLRHRLGRLELVRDTPARRLGRGPELPLQRQGVDLEHHAVGLVGKFQPPCAPGIADLDGGLDAVHPREVRLHGEAGGLQETERLLVRTQPQLFGPDHGVTEEMKRAPRHLAGVQ